MKRLTCEMCNGTDLVKQDGTYVCQFCGTKYSVEEARKMMIEGTVDVQGTVKLDTTDELNNLYQAARNALEADDSESALRHYANISAKDPNSWEALFYLVVLKTNSIKNGEISSAAISVSNCLPKVFELISETIEDDEEKKEAVEEIVDQCYSTASWLTSASHSFCNSMTEGNGMIALAGVSGMITSVNSTRKEIEEDSSRCCTIANIMCHCGNYIEDYFDMNDEDYREYAVISWKNMMDLDTNFGYYHKNCHIFNTESLERFSAKIHRYDPSYEIYDKKKKTREYNLKMASIFSLVCCWCPVLGLILSIWAIEGPKEPEEENFKKRGQIGLVLNIVFTFILMMIILKNNINQNNNYLIKK